ncbi:MAG: hypothetical protein M1827_005176 [Pycnora praestabilis]|nr:MAG: hypothetical protein M1827_005176 [Pycnora praestabilis]
MSNEPMMGKSKAFLASSAADCGAKRDVGIGGFYRAIIPLAEVARKPLQSASFTIKRNSLIHPRDCQESYRFKNPASLSIPESISSPKKESPIQTSRTALFMPQASDFRDALARARNKKAPDIPPINIWAAKFVGRTLCEDVHEGVQPGFSNTEPSRRSTQQRFPFKQRTSNGENVRDHTPPHETSQIPNSAARDAFDQSELTTESPLMALPTEVRLLILEEVLTPTIHEYRVNTSIIFTCKQLYAEGKLIGLEKNTFRRADLPKRYRFRGWGVMMDDCMVRNDRLNLHIDTHGVVSHVNYG